MFNPKANIMKKTVIFFSILFISLAASSQIKTEARCQLWTPKSLCDLPQDLNIPCNISCRDCYWNFSSCEEIAKKGSFKGIKISFSSNSDSVFSLESNFKNFSLKNKTTGKISHPYAILWHNTDIDPKTEEPKDVIAYMINRFRTTEYKVNLKLNESYDLILLFKDAGIGDSFTIDNFMDVKVGG